MRLLLMVIASPRFIVALLRQKNIATILDHFKATECLTHIAYYGDSGKVTSTSMVVAITDKTAMA